MKKYETTQPREGDAMRCSCGSVPAIKHVKVRAFGTRIGEYHEYTCKACGKQWFDEQEVNRLKKTIDGLYLPEADGDPIIKFGEQKRLMDFHMFRYGAIDLE